MTLRSVVKVSERFIIDNSPAILSGIAVAGTVSVAYLTGKATFKAAELIREEQQNQNLQEKGHELDTKEKVKLVWKQYIPPVIVTVGTIGCIMTASTISASRLAAMAAAYKVSEKQYTEYKDKVKELLGDKKAEEVKDAVAADRIANDPYGINEAWDMGNGGGAVLCYDNWNGRYFRSDKQTLDDACNYVNYEVMHNMYATLADFYTHLGLSSPKGAGQMGWNLDHRLKMEYSSQLQADGTPTLVVDFSVPPTPITDFGRFQN